MTTLLAAARTTVVEGTFAEVAASVGRLQALGWTVCAPVVPGAARGRYRAELAAPTR